MFFYRWNQFIDSPSCLTQCSEPIFVSLLESCSPVPLSVFVQKSGSLPFSIVNILCRSILVPIITQSIYSRITVVFLAHTTNELSLVNFPFIFISTSKNSYIGIGQLTYISLHITHSYDISSFAFSPCCASLNYTNSLRPLLFSLKEIINPFSKFTPCYADGSVHNKWVGSPCLRTAKSFHSNTKTRFPSLQNVFSFRSLLLLKIILSSLTASHLFNSFPLILPLISSLEESITYLP